MFKVVWVVGMPRSGSMWTFNVVRELMRRAGRHVQPENVHITDQECVDYANREMVANRDSNTIFVMKMHAYLPDLPPDQLVITNIRDIRDALISYQRFMHVDFEKALAACKNFAKLADHYLDLPDKRRMVLRYDELTATPAEAVARIAARTGVGIDDLAAGEIVAEFSKEKVKALTESKDRQYQRSLEGGRLPAGEILLNRPDGVPATLDRSTGFQSNHVSDYQDGGWRQLLSEEQIGLMKSAFDAWLSRHGFAA